VGAHTKQQSKMYAKGTNVGSGFAADPENTELPLIVKLVKLALVDGSDTELALNGRNERWSLEESSGERLKSARKLRLASRQLVVQADDADILLSGSLLGLDETGSAVDADNETTGDLGIEGTAVASLLNPLQQLAWCARAFWLHLFLPQHALDP
jgi:hypothetical protein